MTLDSPPTVASLAASHGRREAYAYLDEDTKRNVRRAILKALAIPGWQVPFASREMPVARGWGSGGLQVTLALVGPTDTVKVIDQGDDMSVNAVGMRTLISSSARCGETTSTAAATIIQSRHRIPETDLRPDQLLVLQVPHPEPLRRVVPDDVAAVA
ncbi:carbon-phosphorus lyase, partial [Mycobacterium sp. ITM-2017-0098]